jgi:precorrin-6Y C5,15-methyltransferase (decarboxylating)
MNGDKIPIVGIGDDGWPSLTAQAQEILSATDVLVGPEKPLSAVPGEKKRIILGGDLDEAVEAIEAHASSKLAILATGDPLFYGVARYLCNRLGKDRFVVIPHVSSMQLAFARVKESWEEAYLTNLASRPLASVLDRIRSSEKVGLFTSDESPPAIVARTLVDHGIDFFFGYVCENLGSPDERVTQGELAELAEMSFAPLNCMVLVRKPDVPDRPVEARGRRLFGNPDETFAQTKPKRGLLTPAEVRAMALAEMDLGPASIVWDVGAGTGSVSIEAAGIAREGRVYAIEMDRDDHNCLHENAKRFQVGNLYPVLGQAPEALKDLPDPDSVFIGGTGREIVGLIEAVYPRLKVGGRLVCHLGSVDNLTRSHEALHALGSDPLVWMINLARGTSQMDRIRFESLNPTFLLSAIKR